MKKYHTIRIRRNHLVLVATQRIHLGEHYSQSYDYALFSEDHLVATGVVQGDVPKITEKEINERFDKLLSLKNYYPE